MEAKEFTYIAEYIKRFRTTRAWTLESFSKASGVSCSMICQIESGKTIPSLPILHNLTQAMGISLGELIDPEYKPKIYNVSNRSRGKQKFSEDKSFICTHLSEGSNIRQLEVYAFEFKKKGYLVAESHGDHVTEYLIVEKGEMTLELTSHTIDLKAGDVIEFRANTKHTYMQKNSKYASGHSFLYFGI